LEEQIHQLRWAREELRTRKEQRKRDAEVLTFIIVLLNIAMFTYGEVSHLEKESVGKVWLWNYYGKNPDIQS